MEYKDYYDILGVKRTASEKEIKSAYRKLARKYHPDVNPGDKQAEKKFKEINEAQAVLTDPDKRKKYDTLGPDWERRVQAGPRAGTQTYGGGPNPSDFSDFFETLFGQRGTQTSQGQGGFDFDIGSIFGRGKGRRPSAQSGTDVDQPIEVTLQEAFSGAQRTFTVQSTQECPTCHGSGLQGDQLCPTCHGATTIPKTKRLDVKIPAGVREGSRIRIAREGNPGSQGGASGDLYLVVHMVPDPHFRREGDDLYTETSAPVSKLVLGGSVEVPTLSGHVSMKIPAGSQNGRTLRLAGQGMPRLKGGNRGDLYVKVNALLPTAPSEQQRELFQQLAQAGA
jgi:molecular chaperone DnaJ/curved DNA-binding protein